MNKYDTIINTILVILILTIIVVILFGCHYKGCRYFEKFENSHEETEEVSKNEKKKENKKESKEDTKKKTDSDNSLSSFEKTVLEGLSSGSLNTDGLAKLIKEEKFTNMNLNNIINYVEKNKENVY
jgi:mannitol-specific phosphotransferase system IIBC component